MRVKRICASRKKDLVLWVLGGGKFSVGGMTCFPPIFQEPVFFFNHKLESFSFKSERLKKDL
jgi:hypothetical protein